jgi:hypothetical protein
MALGPGFLFFGWFCGTTTSNLRPCGGKLSGEKINSIARRHFEKIQNRSI